MNMSYKTNKILEEEISAYLIAKDSLHFFLKLLTNTKCVIIACVKLGVNGILLLTCFHLNIVHNHDTSVASYLVR